MGSSVTAADSFDYVIVGGGTAGCVLANRLSADPSATVALLEAGGRDTYPWIHIPVGYLYCIDNPRTDWRFRTAPEPGLGGRALNYPRGRVLGGCSSINGMIYMRGQARDYDLWAQQGNRGWSWDDVLPVFKRSEDFFAGADAMHGAGGELRVEEPRLHWALLDAFREAAASVGIPRTDDFNRGDNDGCGYFHVTQKRGLRWNGVRAFLAPVRRRANLSIRTGVTVHRLVIGQKRASGVAIARGDGEAVITARRAVVLAAGAIGSPTILQRSGIGAARRLRDLGIAPVLDLPGVGENLQDHLQLRMAFRVSGVRTLNEWSQTWRGKASIAAQYALFRRGPMTMAPSQLGAFTRSDPSRETPDLEYHVQPLSLDRFGEPLHGFPAFTASVCNLRPRSRGHVRIGSADPAAPPVIQPNYLDDDEDRRVAANAIRLTRRIAAATPLAPYKPEEFAPGPAARSEDELIAAAGRIGTTIFHPVGTCRMGSDEGAVVDDRLRLRGIDGLIIADASIMPSITSGNTNAPTVMIAERAADFLRAGAA